MSESRYPEFAGRRVNDWEVVRFIKREHGTDWWECRCALCGTVRPVRLEYVLKNRSKSCGCARQKHHCPYQVDDLPPEDLRLSKFPDKKGADIGRWKVLRFVARKPGWDFWLCQCSCEAGTLKVVRMEYILRGKSLSCGCLWREKTTAAIRRHGHAKKGEESAEWRAWASMRTRCQNVNSKQYADYGGRGITVCERWEDFLAFLEDMGPRPSSAHSLDRIDNNRGYEPGNCRWATDLVQGRNKRNVVMAEIGGVTKSLRDWCDHYGVVGHNTAKSRIVNLGWDVERAVSTPPGPGGVKAGMTWCRMPTMTTDDPPP